MASKGEDSAESWEKIYLEGNVGWDIKQVSPPIKYLWEMCHLPWLNKGNMMIPGCGYGHEVNFFAQNGFRVFAVDFAPSAVKVLKQKAEKNKNISVIPEDLFQLEGIDLPLMDTILEHTCFCAIPINNREKYVEIIRHFLKVGGYYFGLFYKYGAKEGSGPPHPVSDEEIYQLFSPYFAIEYLEFDKNSVERRRGQEKIFYMKKLK